MAPLLYEELSELVSLHYLAVAVLEDGAEIKIISSCKIKEGDAKDRLQRHETEIKKLAERPFYPDFITLSETDEEGLSEYYLNFRINEPYKLSGVLLLSVSEKEYNSVFKSDLGIILSGLSDILSHYSLSIERGLLDNELLSNREELLAAINSLNGTILLVDDGLIIQNVLGKRYNITPAPLYDLVGKNVDFFGKNLLKAVLKVRKTHFPASIEYPVERKGTKKWYQIDINIISFKDNQKKIALLITDITRLKNVQKRLSMNIDKLEEVNGIKTKLISVITHEFLNPLSIVSTTVEMLELHFNRIMQSDASFKERFNVIYNHIDMINDMIQNFSLMNRLESINLLNLGKVNLTETVLQIAADFNLLYGDIIKVTSSVPEGKAEPGLNADGLLLKNIFINLFNNAIKYSGAPVKVEAKIIYNEAGATVTISDEGIGIAEADLPHVFDSYYRGGNVSFISGSGLGLSIVKNFIEMHGGKINVSSKMGKGTKIKIFLPYGKYNLND